MQPKCERCVELRWEPSDTSGSTGVPIRATLRLERHSSRDSVTPSTKDGIMQHASTRGGRLGDGSNLMFLADVQSVEHEVEQELS
jgi:hypothetical protein